MNEKRQKEEQYKAENKSIPCIDVLFISPGRGPFTLSKLSIPPGISWSGLSNIVYLIHDSYHDLEIGYHVSPTICSWNPIFLITILCSCGVSPVIIGISVSCLISSDSFGAGSVGSDGFSWFTSSFDVASVDIAFWSMFISSAWSDWGVWGSVCWLDSVFGWGSGSGSLL